MLDQERVEYDAERQFEEQSQEREGAPDEAAQDGDTDDPDQGYDAD